jgi:hypothetical protein
MVLSIISGSSLAAAAMDADDAYLEKLLGQWDITGSMGSKALHYHARGERVLQGGFLRLHMVDASSAPQYEADVFIGADPQQHDFVAHWLDRFGAAGARVVGSGKRDDARLVMIFPYVDGAFRDTFTLRPDGGSWSLLLESQNADASWSTFANFTLTRTP